MGRSETIGEGLVVEVMAERTPPYDDAPRLQVEGRLGGVSAGKVIDDKLKVVWRFRRMPTKPYVVAEELYVVDVDLTPGELPHIELGAEAGSGEQGVTFLVAQQHVVDDDTIEEPDAGMAYADLGLQLRREHRRCLRG